MARLTETVTGEHQVVLFLGWPDRKHMIALACTCMGRRGTGRGRPSIDMRSLFPAAEAVAAWRAWHAEKGITP